MSSVVVAGRALETGGPTQRVATHRQLMYIHFPLDRGPEIPRGSYVCENPAGWVCSSAGLDDHHCDDEDDDDDDDGYKEAGDKGRNVHSSLFFFSSESFLLGHLLAQAQNATADKAKS